MLVEMSGTFPYGDGTPLNFLVASHSKIYERSSIPEREVCRHFAHLHKQQNRPYGRIVVVVEMSGIEPESENVCEANLLRVDRLEI